MSTTTPNLGLSQPQMTDQVNQTIPQLANDLSIIDTSVGNLSNLATTNKTSLVAAINENASLIGTENTSIGTLSNLQTTDKSNLVNAINEVNSDLDTETSRRKDLGTNVKDYNASGSTNTYTGTIASGSQTLTLTTSTHDFVVGQGIAIPSAGAAGAKLVTTVSGVNGSTITVSNAANATATSVTVSHDDTVALQAAFNVGGNVAIPSGTYSITSPITISNNVNLFGIVGATIIQNKGSGHGIIVNTDCTVYGININGNYTTGSAGSAVFLNTEARFDKCTVGGSSRYGIEFASNKTIVSCHFVECTIQYNVMGGVYSHADSTYQKNAVSFIDCYVVHNGLNADGSDTTDATPTTGHGYFIDGAIDWSIIGGVSEYNSGAGIYLQSRSDYGIYGFNAIGVHLESNKYCNGYLNAQSSSFMTDINIRGMYYYAMSSISLLPSSLVGTKGIRFIVNNYSLLSYSSIDETYDKAVIGRQFLIPKQSLKIGGEFESVTPFSPYTTHVVSGDPNAGGYNVIRCDSSLGSSYIEPSEFATFIDPRQTYRVVYEYYYTKSSSSSATLYLLQLDANRSNLGSPLSWGLASGGVWYTQEALMTPSQFNSSSRYLQLNPTINGTMASGDVLLIRKVLIYRVDGSSVALSGTTANRPTFVVPGYHYFDTTLNKPVWCKVSGNPCTWVDATGSTV